MSTNEPNHEEHADGIVEDREQRPPVYFNILFFGLIIWGTIFMVYYLFSGWSSSGEFEVKMAAHQERVAEKSPAAAAAPTMIDAAAIYADSCAMCHGAKGEGGIGPDLSSANYIYGKDTAAIKESIAAGRPNGMPGFGNQYSAAEIDALTEYLLTF